MVERKQKSATEHANNLFTGEHISQTPPETVVHRLMYKHTEVVGCTSRGYISLNPTMRFEAQEANAALLVLKDPRPQPKKTPYKEYVAHTAQVFGEKGPPIMVGMCIYGENPARGYSVGTNRLVNSASFVFKDNERSTVHTIIGTSLKDQHAQEVFRWRYHKEQEPFTTTNGVWLPSIQAIQLVQNPHFAYIAESSVVTPERSALKERKKVIEDEIHAGQITYLLQEVERHCLPVKLPVGKR